MALFPSETNHAQLYMKHIEKDYFDYMLFVNFFETAR